MNMNFEQLAMMQKIKSGIDRFRMNHPKFPLFLNAVSQNAIMEGTIIEINVTTPDGKNYCTNLKVKADDMEFIEFRGYPSGTSAPYREQVPLDPNVTMPEYRNQR